MKKVTLKEWPALRLRLKEACTKYREANGTLCAEGLKQDDLLLNVFEFGLYERLPSSWVSVLDKSGDKQSVEELAKIKEELFN